MSWSDEARLASARARHLKALMNKRWKKPKKARKQPSLAKKVGKAFSEDYRVEKSMRTLKERQISDKVTGMYDGKFERKNLSGFAAKWKMQDFDEFKRDAKYDAMMDKVVKAFPEGQAGAKKPAKRAKPVTVAQFKADAVRKPSKVSAADWAGYKDSVQMAANFGTRGRRVNFTVKEVDAEVTRYLTEARQQLMALYRSSKDESTSEAITKIFKDLDVFERKLRAEYRASYRKPRAYKAPKTGFKPPLYD